MDRKFKIRCSAIGKIMSNAKTKGELSQTCKTFLHEWYANDNEEIHSKYIDKGNMVELDAIDFMASELGYGIASKNTERLEDEYFTGECDVLVDDAVIDIKSAWNKKTLIDHAVNGIDKDNEWQIRGYMHLYNKPNGIIFHALMDTPEECNYGNEVLYTDLTNNERWIAFEVANDAEIIEAIKERVIQCREYLETYNQLIINKLGKKWK
jgi:hypothetical protein